MSATIPSHLGDLRSIAHMPAAQEAKPVMPAPAARSPVQAEAVQMAEEAGLGTAYRAAKSPGTAKEVTTLPQAIHLHHDTRSTVRKAYWLSRLRRVNSLFADEFSRDDIALRAEELLMAANEQRDVSRLAYFQAKDPLQRYLYLLEADERAGEGAARDRLKLALDQVWQDNEDEIVAGFNTAGLLMHFARHVERWDAIRGIYFNSVVHDKPLAATFKSLMEKFGHEGVRAAIGALRNAIAADLASPIVCSDKARMQQQHLDLESNRTLSSLLADAETLLRQLQGKDPGAGQVTEFVGTLLEYVAGTANDRKFAALCAVASPQADELAQMRVREFMKRKLPLGLWRSKEDRETVFPLLFRHIARAM